jgi:hypothetical protein
MHGVVSQLVATHLQPVHDKSSLAESELTIALFEHAQPLSAELVASCGVGLDHFAGEVVLAAGLLYNTPRGYEHRLLWGVTAQRTLIGGWSSTKGGFNDRYASIAHHELARVEVKDGMLDSYVKLHSPRGEELLRYAKATALLGRFYQALHVGFQAGTASTAYMLRGPRGSLEQTDAMVAHQIHQLLIHSAPAVLERRCALGWAPSYHELWA